MINQFVWKKSYSEAYSQYHEILMIRINSNIDKSVIVDDSISVWDDGTITMPYHLINTFVNLYKNDVIMGTNLKLKIFDNIKAKQIIEQFLIALEKFKEFL